jgi:hypothetical protein
VKGGLELGGASSIVTRILSAMFGSALAAGLFLPAASQQQLLPGAELPAGMEIETTSVLRLFDGIAGPAVGSMIFFCGALAFFLSVLGLQRLCLAPSIVAAGLVLVARRIVTGNLTGLEWLPPGFLPDPGAGICVPVDKAWIVMFAACSGLAVLALVEIITRQKPDRSSR